jgi:hypothetical protein
MLKLMHSLSGKERDGRRLFILQKLVEAEDSQLFILGTYLVVI